MTPQTENDAYAFLLIMHLRGFVRRLRQMTSQQADWTPDIAAPTARQLAVHAWQWLICDRQHIAEPDALRHAMIPDPPFDINALCDAMAAETDLWQQMLQSLTPAQLDEPRHQFNDYPGNVRGFICHSIQNTIYKHGQFATLFFALGLDGMEAYDAPTPNPIYAEIQQASEPATQVAAE